MSPRLKLLPLLLALTAPALALENDREQPIHLRADWVELDNKRGVSTYRGNVELDQGSLHLEAELITVYRQGEEVERVEAEGNPVRVRQLPEAGAAEIRGHARRAEYRAGEGLLTLSGEAQLQQAADTFSGELIKYDTEQRVVRASGSGEGDTKGDGRVHAIIHPKKDNAQ